MLEKVFSYRVCSVPADLRGTYGFAYPGKALVIDCLAFNIIPRNVGAAFTKTISVTMFNVHFVYSKKENKRLPHQFNLDIILDGNVYRSYQATSKADLSAPIYDFYQFIGMDVKPVFGDIDFPDCQASQKQIDRLTQQLSDFRIFKKLN